MSEQWIVVPRWEDFQHRDAARSQVPPWIKVYTELHSKPEFLDLSFHLRGVLLSIWIEYARSRRQLRGSVPAPRRDRARTLSALCRQLGGNVTARDIERLNHAGFIDLVASKPAGVPAGLEKEKEKEKEKTLIFNGSKGTPREVTRCRDCGNPIEPHEELCARCWLADHEYDPNGEPEGLAQLRAIIAAAQAPDDEPF